MKPRVITPPEAEPITLEEARLHLRLDTFDSPPEHPDDPLVSALITAAREWVENWTGRAIGVQTLEAVFDAFPYQHPHSWLTWPRAIELTGAPVLSIASVNYVDAGGVLTPLTAVQYDLRAAPVRLLPTAGAQWPAVGSAVGGVRVRYVAGYATQKGESPGGELLPQSMKQAMLLLLAHWYENREASGPATLGTLQMGVEMLLRPYRLLKGMA